MSLGLFNNKFTIWHLDKQKHSLCVQYNETIHHYIPHTYKYMTTTAKKESRVHFTFVNTTVVTAFKEMCLQLNIQIPYFFKNPGMFIMLSSTTTAKI